MSVCDFLIFVYLGSKALHQFLCRGLHLLRELVACVCSMVQGVTAHHKETEKLIH